MPVKCHVVYAELSVRSDMPHIAPVLEHLRELGGVATAVSLSSELFMSEPLCRSLLAFCRNNGLAEAAGGECCAITPDGAAALESGRVLVGREGMWKVYIADHGAVRGSMGVVRIEEGAAEAGYMPWIGREYQPPVRDLGEAVRRLEGERLRPALGGAAGEAVVRSVHGSEKRIESDISLTLRVDMDGDGARATLLASRIEDKARGRARAVPGKAELPDAATPTVDDAMEALLGGRDGMEWDAENARIAAGYGGLSDAERTSMQAMIKLEGVEVGGMRFDTAAARAAIFPRNGEDAQRWARHLFAAMATGYVTRSEYERLCEAVAGRLAGFDVRMGDRSSHLPGGGDRTERVGGRPRLFWLIQAMEDWSL